MAGPDDDAPEPFDEEVTSLDETNRLPVSRPDQQTRAYKSAEFLAGRDAGFKEGVDAAVAALSAELIRARATEDEIKHIVARVRAGSVSRA
ncbi:MAG TPA: hypothetical protein VHM31_21820 [Polyangia bacterium]|nr:hypothetical protein [Polyangia bacterium]